MGELNKNTISFKGGILFIILITSIFWFALETSNQLTGAVSGMGKISGMAIK